MSVNTAEKTAMQITVDISLYPLADNYIPAIKDFIERIGAYSDVHIIRNDLSTQLSGDYDIVMDLLKAELRHSWTVWGKGALVVKFLQGDLRGLGDA